MDYNMDYSKFISAIEAYYGLYDSELKKEIVLEYIINRFQESELEDLFKLIISRHPSQYKTPPDVAVIQDLTADSLDAEALAAWDLVCHKVNPYKDCVFADKRIYAALRSMGGHVNFSKRLQKDEVWEQKRFIEYYKIYTDNPPGDVKPIMPGLSTLKDDYLMIGDKVKCREIIAENGSGQELIEDLTRNIKSMEATG